jgi:hypothetical protein
MWRFGPTDDDDGRENHNDDVNDHDYDTVYGGPAATRRHDASRRRRRTSTVESPPQTHLDIPGIFYPIKHDGLQPNTDRTDMTIAPTGARYSDSPDARLYASTTARLYAITRTFCAYVQYSTSEYHSVSSHVSRDMNGLLPTTSVCGFGTTIHGLSQPLPSRPWFAAPGKTQPDADSPDHLTKCISFFKLCILMTSSLRLLTSFRYSILYTNQPPTPHAARSTPANPPKMPPSRFLQRKRVSERFSRNSRSTHMDSASSVARIAAESYSA